MSNLWFSYSTVQGLDAPEPPNSPYSLTWNVGRFLRDKAASIGYQFEYRNLDDTSHADIGADDIIIAHSWYPSGFMTETLDKPCKARFLLQPYQHDIVGKNESWWIKAIADKCNHLFFVTGKYWWDTMHEGLYGDWKAKATRLDMAINCELHSHSKQHFNQPGRRAVLAIGADIPYKGLDMIAKFAQVGGFKLGYYGNAPFERFQHVPQFTHYGGLEFTLDVQAQISNEYDFFISLAIGDANPTTLLETSSWGMLALCNKESGYWAGEPFMELRKDDMIFNLAQLDYLQLLPEYSLKEHVKRVQAQIVKEHSWQKFNETIWQEVEKWL